MTAWGAPTPTTAPDCTDWPPVSSPSTAASTSSVRPGAAPASRPRFRFPEHSWGPADQLLDVAVDCPALNQLEARGPASARRSARSFAYGGHQRPRRRWAWGGRGALGAESVEGQRHEAFGRD